MVNRIDDETEETQREGVIIVDDKHRSTLDAYTDTERGALIAMQNATRHVGEARRQLWAYLAIIHPEVKDGSWEYNWKTHEIIKRG